MDPPSRPWPLNCWLMTEDNSRPCQCPTVRINWQGLLPYRRTCCPYCRTCWFCCAEWQIRGWWCYGCGNSRRLCVTSNIFAEHPPLEVDWRGRVRMVNDFCIICRRAPDGVRTHMPTYHWFTCAECAEQVRCAIVEFLRVQGITTPGIVSVILRFLGFPS